MRGAAGYSEPVGGPGRIRADQHLHTIGEQLANPIDAVRAVGYRGGQIGERITRCVNLRPPIGVRQHLGDLRRQSGQIGQLLQHPYRGMRNRLAAVR